MLDTANKSSSDFAGFIDGFQARNLSSIQRNVALQLSEMQTRLAVIKGQIRSDFTELGLLEPGFSSIEAAFRERSETIVERLVMAGQRLTDVIIQHGKTLSERLPICTQVKGFILAYVEAAEISRNERMIGAAIQLANAFREMVEVPAN